jgi:hypothetical protein
VTDEDALAASFQAHRSYLHAIACRRLGSHADADDAVQEAWLRLGRTGSAGIEDLRGWLTTVTGLPGVLITVAGRPVTVMAFTVTNGAITAIHALTAPTRLGQVVPSWVA